MHFCKFLEKQEEIRQQKWVIIPPLELGFFPLLLFFFPAQDCYCPNCPSHWGAKGQTEVQKETEDLSLTK